ncbi:hypothetical protein SJ612_00645 [Enterococcus faecium]
MNAGIADMNLIKKTLNDFTFNSISKGTGINLSTIKKLKSGERSVEKLNLLDAIKITEFAMKNGKAEIEIWR